MKNYNLDIVNPRRLLNTEAEQIIFCSKLDVWLIGAIIDAFPIHTKEENAQSFLLLIIRPVDIWKY